MAGPAPIPLSSLALPDLYRLASQLRTAVRPEPTEAVLREILKRQPEEAQVRFALGYLLLARGAWEEGWPLYEARSEVAANDIRRPRFRFPEWRGEAVGSILLYPEQGIGDQILFARYAALLKARGVAVTMLVSEALERLFATLGVQVLVGGVGVAVPRCDAWAMVGSLARWLGPYSPERYFPGADGGKGLGVVTRGSPRFAKDAQRSLPPEMAAELMALPGAVSLQPEDTGARDLMDTAEIISGLERVVAVDTGVANLACAMGKPTFVLLSHDPDWRWGWAGETSPWYPTARLIRQTAPGDWRGVLDRLKAALG